jgi:hypothetical protein
MPNLDPIFMPGDKVFYNGEKLARELTREGKSLTGWIHAPVLNEPGAWVVFFPETKEQDSYILSAKNLTHYRPSKNEKQSGGPDVQPRRRKQGDTE